MESTTDQRKDEMPKLTGGKRNSRRQSRKSRRDEIPARRRQHKGGKSRRTGRSRRTTRKH